MSSSSPSLSARSTSTSASKITSATQEHRINTYLTQNTLHTKEVEGLIAFLDGNPVDKREREDSPRTPLSSGRLERSLEPAFVPSSSGSAHSAKYDRRGISVRPEERESLAGMEGGPERQKTPIVQHRGASSRDRENLSPSAMTPQDTQGRPALDSTKSEISRLQQEVSSIQALINELQASISTIQLPTSSQPPPQASEFFPSSVQLASPEVILDFIRNIDSLANLRHRRGDLRRDEDIFTKHNLQKLRVRIDAWEKIARNR